MMNTQCMIAGAKLSRQLNGTSVYIVFEGEPEAITGAFNTLWNANAYSSELEWINDKCAVVTTTPVRFQKGLVNRELLRLLGDDMVCSKSKGKRSGLMPEAHARANAFWVSMQDVRVVTPISYVAPYFHRISSPRANNAGEWATERVDATCE